MADATMLVQVVSDTEALMVCQEALHRLRSSSCTVPREEGRRKEVQFVVSRCRNFVSGAADPATAARVLSALGAEGVPDLTKLKLLNARATTEIRAYLADVELEEPARLAKVVADAWEGGALKGAGAGESSGGGGAQ